MLWGENRGKWKGWQLPGIESRTPGLCSQCSATELRQPDNHQSSQSSICTAPLHGWWSSSCCSSPSVAEHWLHKPGVLGSIPGDCRAFHFPLFSHHLSLIQHEARVLSTWWKIKHISHELSWLYPKLWSISSKEAELCYDTCRCVISYPIVPLH